MTDDTQAIASATIAKVLDHVVTMRAESIDIQSRGAEGSVALVSIEGGGHEIICEVNAEGDLLSARVIEL